MTDRYIVREIRQVPMSRGKDNTPALNGSAYEVDLAAGSHRKLVTVVLTAVAESELATELGGSATESLVRDYVQRELERGWIPDNYPWLTIESHNIAEAVQHLKMAVR